MSGHDQNDTFICVRRGGVRVTPQECSRLRSLPRQLTAHGKPGVEYMPLTCEYCRDWPRMIGADEIAEPVPGKPMETVEKKPVEQARRKKQGHTTGICLECGKEGEIVARGLDRRCYNRLHAAGTLDKLYPRRPNPGSEIPRIRTENKQGGGTLKNTESQPTENAAREPKTLRRHNIERKHSAEDGRPEISMAVTVRARSIAEMERIYAAIAQAVAAMEEQS